jgi:hypothetical protein
MWFAAVHKLCWVFLSGHKISGHEYVVRKVTGYELDILGLVLGKGHAMAMLSQAHSVGTMSCYASV